MDGWIKNVAVPIENPFQPGVAIPGARHGKRSPETEEYAARLTLSWEPSPDFDAEAKLMYHDHEGNGRTGYGETFCIGSTTIPTQSGIPIPNADCRKDRVKAESSIPSQFAGKWPEVDVKDGVLYDEGEFFIASLRLNKRFGALELASTSGYYDQNEAGSYNADYGAFAQALVPSKHDYRQFTQEIRLTSEFEGPFNFMVGGFFEDGKRYWVNAPDLFHTYDPVFDTYADAASTSDTDTRSISFFGAVNYQLTPTIELSGGLRYSKDKKSAVLVNKYVNPNSIAIGGLRAQGDALFPVYKDDNLSPEVTVSWKPSRDHLLFAAYKTGYKAGGISNDALLSPAATVDTVKFGNEEVEGFEVGYKGTLADGTLQFDVTGYYYDYKGLQVASYDVDALRSRIFNAAKVRTTGVTATATFQPTDRLSFNGNLGYNDAEYVSFENAACYSGQTEAEGCIGGFQDNSGKAPNRAPKWNLSFGGNYLIDLGGGWNSRISVSTSYSSSYQTNTDFAPGGVQDGYWLLNASVRVASDEDKGLELALIGRNLTNSYYMIYNFQQPFTGNPEQYYGVFNRPREVALQASFRF
ncbi:TonB-dependent receptor [Novosphingobium sp. PC22D]|uniref:TonB-dependent receptor n=1 Tax=Novosphingobium sp. PC22D TaxID=1962403 RepID=UPI001145CD3D|nr:TonB-dependent receptor [Novosphingobium sp. PC22D]